MFMCAKMSSLLSFSFQFVVKKVECDEEEVVKKKINVTHCAILDNTIHVEISAPHHQCTEVN